MGFGHSSAGTQSLCVELASIIHANFHVAATVPPRLRHCSLYIDFEGHYESTINSKAIELAVNLRALMDRCSLLANPRPLPQEIQNTSALRFIEGSGKSSLRECTSKIIHASHFEFQYGRYDSRNQDGETFSNRVQESAVLLVGRRGSEHWKCSLDLLAFTMDAHHSCELMAIEFDC